jgi:hypothetical protein
MATSVLEKAVFAAQREQALRGRSSGYPGAVAPPPDKLAAIKAATEAFLQARIGFALIGGLAVGVRSGVPRATLDVDFAVPSSSDRAQVIAALLACQMRLKGQFAHSVNFEHESGEPVQLAFDPVFDPMIARAELMTFGDIALPVVTTEDLIAMKRLAAADPLRRRSKALRDQADIALLEGDVGDPDEGW